MQQHAHPRLLLLLLPALLTVPARADEALGTLTVKGKTTILKEVIVTEQADPNHPADRWLVILASDRKVEGERTIARLTEMARAGKLHAVRILWHVGTDGVRAVPYDAALEQSGRMGVERPTLDLKRYGKGRLEAEFRSKMTGQNWHFHANVKAAVAEGGTFELEPEAEEVADTEPPTPGAASDASSQKLALGKLGYEYTDSMFVHAISDGSLDAVRLFLQIGMTPNAHGKGDPHPMLHAAQLCANQAESKPRSQILEALVAAGGDVKAKDENGSTPLLWAAQTGCTPSVVRALLKAGADPNARAKGGATPLMFADIFQRKEIGDLLRAAGGKK